MSRKAFWPALAFCAATLAPAPAALLIKADSTLGVTFTSPGNAFSGVLGQGLYAAFTLTAGYTDVDIRIWLASGTSLTPVVYSGLLDVFLTAGLIGPGTTVANEVASASLNLNLAASSIQDVSTYQPVLVLSGLTLPAGTYYLSARNPTPSGTLFWAGVDNLMNIVTAPTATLLGAGSLSESPAPSYFPSATTTFFSNSHKWIEVTGTEATAVPEPSNALPLALVAVYAFARRRARSAAGGRPQV